MTRISQTLWCRRRTRDRPNSSRTLPHTATPSFACSSLSRAKTPTQMQRRLRPWPETRYRREAAVWRSREPPRPRRWGQAVRSEERPQAFFVKAKTAYFFLCSIEGCEKKQEKNEHGHPPHDQGLASVCRRARLIL